jgi:hypothetical protein
MDKPTTARTMRTALSSLKTLLEPKEQSATSLSLFLVPLHLRDLTEQNCALSLFVKEFSSYQVLKHASYVSVQGRLP